MNINQQKAPLFDKLVSHFDKTSVSFHVPGHKSGRGLDNKAEHFFKKVMSIDYTEITGLDDLHQPEGVIKEAQGLAAECFKSKHTFFLVNGSTAGNLALILSICGKNDLLIVERNVHKSVLHGLMLAGAKAVFLPPRWERSSGLAAGVRVEDVELALSKYPHAKGVLLTRPNYYGIGMDLQSITEAVHAHRMPLLIDEAHGAHYGFHPSLPRSALSYGADGVVQSTHKMLSALTMGAMLHIQGDILRAEVIQQRLSMLQSSSPSYPIMASLDVCRRLMATQGEESIAKGLKAVQFFKESFLQFPWFGIADHPTVCDTTQDPFKVSIWDRTGTMTGYEIKQALELHGCMIEMADPRHALLFFSLFSTREDSQKLIQAFQQISHDFSLKKKELQGHITNINTIPVERSISSPIVLDLPYNDSAQTVQNNIETVNIADTVDAYSAEMVTPYPPGIPLLYPGEKITSNIVEHLQKLSALGATFQGLRDPQLKTLQVYR